jgi:pimeloyl-ACP methyl ester carboxylesterase
MPQLTVNGTSVYYEDEGTGPALLFLHGWGTNARVWGAQQAELVATHRVVSPDWRGCGRSDRPAAGNSIDGVVDDLVALVGALDLRQPVVIGSSIGGTFATELALRRPKLVRGVISVDGPAYWPSQRMDLAGLISGLRSDRAAFLADWVPNWYAPGTSPTLIDWTVGQILDSGPYIDAQFRDFATYDPRPRLSSLPIPIHYLHGQLDAEIPVDVARECAHRTSGAQLSVIPGSGHMPHQERPAAFNAALRDALNRMPAPQPAV